MQRTEGGGLGVGGSSSGFMTARGAADFLTRATSILGGLFIILSIAARRVSPASTRKPARSTPRWSTRPRPAPRHGSGRAGQPGRARRRNDQAPAVPLAQ